MSLSIRAADARDAAAIRQVQLVAFPTAMEADLVEQLEQDGSAMLSLVAEDQSEIICHIMMSRMRVEGEGRSFKALGLGPVAVIPGRQGEGTGSALIRGALARAMAGGEEIVFLLGEPDYYGRFGFAAAIAAPFESPYAGPYFMARALADVKIPTSGRAEYPPAFATIGEAG